MEKFKPFFDNTPEIVMGAWLDDDGSLYTECIYDDIKLSLLLPGREVLLLKEMKRVIEEKLNKIEYGDD